jgi:dihydrofolate reductase
MASRIALIVAVAENGVIGARGQLPWHLPADLRRFKQLTMGHTLVMGRLTYESIGRPLPGRTSIVITGDLTRRYEGCLVAHSWEEACRAAPADRDLFVIGGRQVFAAALPFADCLHWTQVHAAVEGDVYFPSLDWQDWELRHDERHEADERHAYAYSFRDYARRS